MTLKELYKNTNADRLQDIVYNYLHKSNEYRNKLSFEDYIECELEFCSICGEVNEKDLLKYHEYDDLKVCEDCRRNE